MNKLYLSSALLAIFALPAFADIDKSASTATCDSSTIGAISGTAYMDTAWTANTINLDFYSDGEKISTGSCTYDGAIELPSNPEDKTGYTFGGWQLRRAPAAQTTFDLSTWEYGSYVDMGYSRLNGDAGSNESQYSLTVGSGEWAIEFTNGTIKGESVCAINTGTHAVAGDPEGTNVQYCWCRATYFDEEKDGTYLNVSKPSWVYLNTSANMNTSACAASCASNCVGYIKTDTIFRAAVLGATE